MEWLVVLLVILLIIGLPTWQHSAGWGYGPSGILGIVLVVILLFWLFGGGLPRLR